MFPTTAREYSIVSGRILIKSIRANSCPTCPSFVPLFPSPRSANQLPSRYNSTCEKCETVFQRMYLSVVQVCISTRARKVWWTRSRRLWKFTRTEPRISWTILRTRIIPSTPSWAAREGNPGGTLEICFSSKRNESRSIQKEKRGREGKKIRSKLEKWNSIMKIYILENRLNRINRVTLHFDKYRLKIIILSRSLFIRFR